MIKYFIKRFVLLCVTSVGVVLLLYMIFAFINLDVWTRGISSLGMIKYAWMDFKQFFTGIVTEWDWGQYAVSVEVWDRVIEELPTTFKINALATIAFLFGGVTLGIITAYYHGTIIDKIVSNVFILFASVPSFVLMFFFVLFFGYYLKWFPARYDYYADGVLTHFKANFLPIFALAIVPTTRIMRILRAELIESKNEEYYLLSRIKGFSRFRTLMRHSLRNCILPIFAEIPRLLSMVLSMSFIIEIIYNIQGAGILLYESIITPHIDGNYLRINVPVATLICSCYVMYVLVITFFMDIVQGFIDPRVKLGSKKSSYLGAK